MPSEGSDQSVHIRRLIKIFAGRTCPKVRFLTLRLIFCVNMVPLVVEMVLFCLTFVFILIVLISVPTKCYASCFSEFH